jgi:hypothetical protein
MAIKLTLKMFKGNSISDPEVVNFFKEEKSNEEIKFSISESGLAKYDADYSGDRRQIEFKNHLFNYYIL